MLQDGERNEKKSNNEKQQENQHFRNCRHRKYYSTQWTKLFAKENTNTQQFAQAANWNFKSSTMIPFFIHFTNFQFLFNNETY